jgi:hypothetical protein
LKLDKAPDKKLEESITWQLEAVFVALYQSIGLYATDVRKWYKYTAINREPKMSSYSDVLKVDFFRADGTSSPCFFGGFCCFWNCFGGKGGIRTLKNIC